MVTGPRAHSSGARRQADIATYAAHIKREFRALPAEPRAADDNRLAAIYGHAAWCASQRSQPLWNSAGVAFYEHLFDEPWMWESVPRWLSADIRAECMGLWEARLSPKDFALVMKLLAANPPL